MRPLDEARVLTKLNGLGVCLMGGRGSVLVDLARPKVVSPPSLKNVSSEIGADQADFVPDLLQVVRPAWHRICDPETRHLCMVT